MRKRMGLTDLEYEFNWDGNESQYDAQSLHGHMAYGRGGDLNSVQQPFQLRPGILLYCMVFAFLHPPLDFPVHQPQILSFLLILTSCHVL